MADYAALRYIGNCAWEPMSEVEPDDPPNELPTSSEAWLGSSALLADFLAAHPIGQSYLGGFVTARHPRVHSAGMHTCELVVARPPLFGPSLSANAIATRTAQLSATVRGAIDEEGRFQSGTGKIEVERSVSYYTIETRYTYFTAQLPAGARFGTVASNAIPRIFRSLITARDGNREVRFAGANAPAPIVSALATQWHDALSGHNADPIPGTPWYRCTDSVTRELAGE